MKNYILIILVFTVILISGCIQPNNSHELITCPGFYYLETSVNHNISNDNEAFEALKQFWTVYDTEGGTKWVEDAIPSDMSATEALQQGILKKDQTITLRDEGNIIENVWMLYTHKAVDTQGNVYSCDFEVNEPITPSPIPGPPVCGDGYCHTEESSETCPEDCPVLPQPE
jgi:hypothetical protein